MFFDGLIKNLSTDNPLFIENPDNVLDRLSSIFSPEMANIVYLDVLFNHRLNFSNVSNEKIKPDFLSDERIYFEKDYEFIDSIQQKYFGKSFL